MNEIKEGALFISDAHDNAKRKGFYQFLKEIQTSKTKPPQLFFMGDMFDLLVGEIEHTVKQYQETINLINELSYEIEIIYFEGNHDFNLKKLFPQVKVIPITKQPKLFIFKNNIISLCHGDIYEDEHYLRYTKIIRNHTLLNLLNLFNKSFNNFISKKILLKQEQKYICKKQSFFYSFIKQKLQKYDIGDSKINFVCEGHHHQNEEFVFGSLRYKNFSSFACDKSYYQISFTDKIIFKEL